jgi:thiol-disulfide isomerase/thioredoxin
MRRLSRIILLVAVVAIAVAVRPAAAVRAAGSLPLAVGAAAPPLSEPTARGPFDSASSAKPYLVEFFAVWCPHCQREVPVMNRLEDADGGQVDIIAVPASPFGFDQASMLQPADLQTFAQRFDAHYRIGFDGYFSAVYDYGVAAYPTFYVVGADRRVAAVESGEVPFDKLHAEVRATLK